jgi:Holliday junction resolvasome RuvABC endonuclease subunit
MSHVWGIDPGINKVAFAYTAGSLTWTETLVVPEGDPQIAGKLRRLMLEVRSHARHQASYGVPDCVWVEQPSGQHRNLRLVYAVGVIIAAVYAATGAPVWEISPSAWKRPTVGRGQATKEEIWAWVEQRRIPIGNQDEADAACIALAGAAKFDAGQWEATPI